MAFWQRALILLFGLVSLVIFFKGFHESKNKKNAFGLMQWFLPWGIFAWGDAVIFGPFWFVVSLVALYMDKWYLFLLLFSVFWVVRSLGETIYWFNQQFTSKSNEPVRPENLPWHSIFHDESIWFIFQIFWQCVTVVSIVASIYFANLWLK